MLSEREIQDIIEAQDMKYYPREQLSGKGDGVSKTYVRVFKTVSKKRIFIDLGRIEQVAQMSSEELVETIQQKFAEKLRLKLSIQST